MQDFENYKKSVDGEAVRRIDQADLHADKNANATFLIEKQRWVYQHQFYTHHLQRLGRFYNEDIKRAVAYRYV